MGIIIGGILIVFGLSWLGMTAAFYFGFNLFMDFKLPGWSLLLFGGVGVAQVLVGILVLVKGISSRQKNQEKAMDIYNNGIPARGRVTFVDRNYSVLMNERPIYSIVEFSFTDHRGQQHISRKDQVPSELVIRSQINVGSEVDLKYLAADPDQNALLIKEPTQ